MSSQLNILPVENVVENPQGLAPNQLLKNIVPPFKNLKEKVVRPYNLKITFSVCNLS
jgi:hypothetical protein